MPLKPDIFATVNSAEIVELAQSSLVACVAYVTHFDCSIYLTLKKVSFFVHCELSVDVAAVADQWHNPSRGLVVHSLSLLFLGCGVIFGSLSKCVLNQSLSIPGNKMTYIFARLLYSHRSDHF